MPQLVHPKERIYFVLSAIITVGIYVGIAVTGPIWLLAVPAWFAFEFFGQGVAMGMIRGNAIRLSEAQFPEVYRRAREIATQMGFKYLPALYVLQAEGALNAFATRFARRNFVVIFSDVLELAYERGEDALTFILTHELAHIKRNHVRFSWLIDGNVFIPPLALALSRAREYTCDRYAAYHCPNGIVDGLTLLAAGKRLYKQVNRDEYLNQMNRDKSFWIWLAEMLSTHPCLPHRIREALAIRGGAPVENSSAAPTSSSPDQPLPSHIA